MQSQESKKGSSKESGATAKSTAKTTANSHSESYELLDSGDGRKLERVGAYKVERQAAVAMWKPALPSADWKKVDAFHNRSDTGGGHWDIRSKIPESWLTRHGGLLLKTKLTSFGHLGFFPEQAQQWEWFRKAGSLLLKKHGPSLKILNLFAYTGGSTLALAQAGAEVTHVDAAKGIVDWAKENTILNDIPNGRARFIVEDCQSFLNREERRGNKYDGVVLDPPSFGRGPNKEVFKIEEHLIPLLESVSKILVPQPKLIHMSSHTAGFSAEVLRNLIAGVLRAESPAYVGEQGEMFVDETSRKWHLPSGTFCRLHLPC